MSELMSDRIADALYGRDLPLARRLFDAATADPESVERLVRQLAATVTLPPGMVVWGFGLDIWANPNRDAEERAWRCGGCRWTASHYRTDRAAVSSAEEHNTEHHRGGLTVVSYLDGAYWDAVEASYVGR